MAAMSSGSVTFITTKKSLKPKPERLPWPRKASDNPAVDLGVDVVRKRTDIIKLVHKFFHVESIPMEELLQEVYLAILHKNHTRSAHDPRKSSFGHYVYMIANNVCINLVHKKKRYDRERDSIYESMDDEELPLIETTTAEAPDTSYESEGSEILEAHLRKNHHYQLARYVRASRFGASPAAIKEALSTTSATIDAKTLKRYRQQVVEIIDDMGLASML